jgi:hypothetical protein
VLQLSVRPGAGRIRLREIDRPSQSGLGELQGPGTRGRHHTNLPNSSGLEQCKLSAWRPECFQVVTPAGTVPVEAAPAAATLPLPAAAVPTARATTTLHSKPRRGLREISSLGELGHDDSRPHADIPPMTEAEDEDDGTPGRVSGTVQAIKAIVDDGVEVRLQHRSTHLPLHPPHNP